MSRLVLLRTNFLTNPRMELYLSCDRQDDLTIRIGDFTPALEMWQSKLNGRVITCMRMNGSAYSLPLFMGKKSCQVCWQGTWFLIGTHPTWIERAWQKCRNLFTPGVRRKE